VGDERDAVLEAIADPQKGPAVAQTLLAELDPLLEAIRADDVSATQPSDEELGRRVAALRAASDRLARLSAIAGYWAPPETVRVWPQ
jgi:hypothetical protein